MDFIADLLDYDNVGNVVVLGDGSVPSDREAMARRAVDNCPEGALCLLPDLIRDRLHQEG